MQNYGIAFGDDFKSVGDGFPVPIVHLRTFDGAEVDGRDVEGAVPYNAFSVVQRN